MTPAPAATAALAVPAERGSCPFAPPPPYQRARREEPVSRITLWDQSQCWMVTRHEDVRAVLGDARFSADAGRAGFPFLSPGRKAVNDNAASFLRMDDPEHARLRRMLTGDFTIKKIEALRPRIQRLVDGFLDELIARGAPADLVAGYALPIPSLVICLLLGVPYEDHAYFQGHSRVLLDNRSSTDQVREVQSELLAYLGRLAEHKRRHPEDDIISRLMARDDLDGAQAAAMARLLLVAGHETTANMTALSALALLRNPDQLARLRADPLLIKGAVEELLRYLTIVQSGAARVATEDVQIGGQLVRAGEGVVCMLSAANWDDGAFPGAASLDVGRNARRHVAFGFGVHQCLGQPLARVELQIALETLIRRLPGLKLAVPFEEVRFRHDMIVYGVHELPVSW